jgi:hypothetical protein
MTIRLPVLGSARPVRARIARAFGLGILEMAQQHLGVGHVEIVARVFLLGLAEDVAVAQRDGASGSLNGMSITWSMPSTYIASRSSP